MRLAGGGGAGQRPAGRTRIKVCGITTAADAEAAVAAGADALGFIFAAQSPRRIEAEAAREIIRQLPPFISTVGVFVDENQRLVENLSQYCRLGLVQLHGAESPAYCRSLSCPAIKSFRVGPALQSTALAPYAGQVIGFLLDTYQKDMAGGTGTSFDWQLVEKIKPPGPIILAGGLSPANIIAAIKQVRPYAVDVNSGVELQPGRKDHAQLKDFVEKVRQADTAFFTPGLGACRT